MRKITRGRRVVCVYAKFDASRRWKINLNSCDKNEGVCLVGAGGRFHVNPRIRVVEERELGKQKEVRRYYL